MKKNFNHSVPQGLKKYCTPRIFRFSPPSSIKWLLPYNTETSRCCVQENCYGKRCKFFSQLWSTPVSVLDIKVCLACPESMFVFFTCQDIHSCDEDIAFRKHGPSVMASQGCSLVNYGASALNNVFITLPFMDNQIHLIVKL